MKKNLLIYLLTFILFGCIPSGGMSEEEINYLKKFKPYPYTEKEKDYILELKNKGLHNIKIMSPYNCLHKSYQIYCDSDSYYDFRKGDSIVHLSREIAKDLYSKTLEDSVIVRINYIQVQINFKSKKNKKNIVEFWRIYKKSWLEKELGFRVKDYGEDYYARIWLRNE
jgi:hypothetical protein